MVCHKRFCYKSFVRQNVLWLIAGSMAPVSCIMSLLWCLLYDVFCIMSPVSCLLSCVSSIMSHTCFSDLVAQLVEPQEVLLEVIGSNPVWCLFFPSVLKIHKLSAINAWKSAKIPKSYTIDAWKCPKNTKIVRVNHWKDVKSQKSARNFRNLGQCLRNTQALTMENVRLF